MVNSCTYFWFSSNFVKFRLVNTQLLMNLCDAYLGLVPTVRDLDPPWCNMFVIVIDLKNLE